MEPLHTLFMSAGPEVGPRNASFSPRRLSYFPLPINSFTSIIIYQKKKKKNLPNQFWRRLWAHVIYR